MPHIEANIVRAWRHKGEPNKIHYIIMEVLSGKKSERHLVELEGSALYVVLEGWLEFMGYDGPASEETSD